MSDCKSPIICKKLETPLRKSYLSSNLDSISLFSQFERWCWISFSLYSNTPSRNLLTSKPPGCSPNSVTLFLHRSDTIEKSGSVFLIWSPSSPTFMFDCSTSTSLDACTYLVNDLSKAAVYASYMVVFMPPPIFYFYPFLPLGSGDFPSFHVFAGLLTLWVFERLGFPFLTSVGVCAELVDANDDCLARYTGLSSRLLPPPLLSLCLVLPFSW